jgi:NAD(P)-dependent dehydrogenase (short-subunit alcohol dehydrogenase family)
MRVTQSAERMSMIDGLSGKAAIVTGAGQGIGRATAALLARSGMHIGCLDIDEASASAAAAALRAAGGAAEPLVADVSDRDRVGAIIRDFGKKHGLAVLVNNAIWLTFEDIEAISPQSIDRMLAVGIKGPLWCLQAALPHLAAAAQSSGDAAVVNVASAAAFQGMPGRAVYSAVKGALVSMTRQNAVELGARGIRVNAVAPGPIPTEGAQAVVTDPAGGRLARTIERTPLGRLGTPDEVASAIALLAAPASRWITGQIIAVDGGRVVSAR